MPFQDPSGRWLSDDGFYHWDGAAWQPVPRPAPRTGPPPALMGLAIGCAALVLLGAVAGGVVALQALRRLPSTPPVAHPRVLCQPAEQLEIHYHSHLALVHDGSVVTLPAGIGIEPLCYYWLHTHDTSGIIHVETPGGQAGRVFTLADFFAVWGQPIGSHQAGPAVAESGEQLRTWVQPHFDSEPQLWAGSPGAVPLRDCAAITIVIGPAPQPPPAFTWPQGFLCDPGSSA